MQDACSGRLNQANRTRRVFNEGVKHLGVNRVLDAHCRADTGQTQRNDHRDIALVIERLTVFFAFSGTRLVPPGPLWRPERTFLLDSPSASKARQIVGMLTSTRACFLIRSRKCSKVASGDFATRSSRSSN